MPPATPSEARVKGVLAAIKASGLEPVEVVVDPDGGFRVTTRPVDRKQQKAAQSPVEWE